MEWLHGRRREYTVQDGMVRRPGKPVADFPIHVEDAQESRLNHEDTKLTKTDPILEDAVATATTSWAKAFTRRAALRVFVLRGCYTGIWGIPHKGENRPTIIGKASQAEVLPFAVRGDILATMDEAPFPAPVNPPPRYAFNAARRRSPRRTPARPCCGRTAPRTPPPRPAQRSEAPPE